MIGKDSGHFNITMASLDDDMREFQYYQCTEPSRDKVRKVPKIRNRYNQVPHQTHDTTKVTKTNNTSQT